MPLMIEDHLFCNDFFTREKMTKLGIKKDVQSRIRNLFNGCHDDHYRWKPYGPFFGYSVQNLINNGWNNFQRGCGVGPKVIEAVNLVLKSEGLPELVPPNVEQKKNP